MPDTVGTPEVPLSLANLEGIQCLELKESLSFSAAEYLEEVRQQDPETIEQLIETRVPCNTALAEHKDLLVCTSDNGRNMVGPLGVLNGLLLRLTGGRERVAAIFDDNTRLVGFRPIKEER